MKSPPPDPLHVLMVNTRQTGSGAGRAGETLAAELGCRGHAVHAYVAANPTQDPRNRPSSHWRLLAQRTRFARWGLPDLLDPFSFAWPARPEFAGADILHLHNLHGSYLSLGALPLWAGLKPTIWTLHDHWPLTGNCATPHACERWRSACGRCPNVGVYPMPDRDTSRFYRWLKPRLFAWAAPRLVTPSIWLGERARRLPQLAMLPWRVIRYPIDCETFRPAPDRAVLRRKLGLDETRPTVVMSGADWSDHFKGPDQAIAALHRAAAALPRLQLLIIGRFGEDLLAQAGLPGVALPFLAGRAALAEAYAAADVLLFPSRAENYPLTILEAFACETPAVAYDVGGIPEQIEDGWNGYVARDGHPDELAAGLVRLLRDPSVARACGRHGRRFVLRTSSIPSVTDQYHDEYRRAYAAWQRRRRRPSPRFTRPPILRAVARTLGWELDCIAPQPRSSSADAEALPVAHGVDS
jgi:glycosyltransferase involved in cell wall biosynthesis